MYTASDLRKGLKIEMDGAPYEVTEFQFVKPGKGQAMYKTKLKNMLTGYTVDKTFRAVDKIGRPNLEEKDMVYSYPDAHGYAFMDTKTYETIHLNEEALGQQRFFLIEDMEVKILFYNDQAIAVTLPNFVEFEITETEPGVRGDTATNVTKPAKIKNGYEINVPLFINQGDTVRIDTRTGQYADRVAKG